ncbi:hypothetical protein HY02_07095 [Peptococcaceae bacterium SCADC1_2_3]|nr:hypothetical protein DK28_0213080 [Peptococcaceae bacterium SCADC1_2_3]KFI37423.1 hypothetical protein HY02_07095 [Peptococcaceae bacterium SCADC1_2_3]
MKKSLPQDNVKFIRTTNDIGVVFKENSVIVDKEKTKEKLINWSSLWGNYIENEKAFCRKHKIGLIISDITPQVFVVAKELNIPGIAISNFTWHYIYDYLFEDMPIVNKIKEAYQLASLALDLPFNEEMKLFKEKKEISLVSRNVIINRNVLRKRYMISENEILVYIGVGKSFNPSFVEKMTLPYKKGVKVLISAGSKLTLKAPISFKIPPGETEAQNYLGMCDLIVSKTGYGTISEAIQAQVPMLLLQRNGFKEDELFLEKVQELGIGGIISEKSFLSGDWINRISEIKNMKINYRKIPERYIQDGAEEAVYILKHFIGE